MTRAQKLATRWLSEHNADGGFDRHGVLIAGGEKAPFMRSTWNAICEAGMAELYALDTPRKRLRLTVLGLATAEKLPPFEETH